MRPTADTAAAPLLSRNFLLLLVATFGVLANYATLLSVVPLWAASGGASDELIGATTGVMMGATVLTQLAMGWFFRFITLRGMMLAGSLLLALATPAYALSAEITPVLAISAVRGVGFAFVVVAGAALVAELVTPDTLGRATGMYGIATGLPSVLLLPLGVWFAQTVDFLPVFVATGVLALIAVPFSMAISAGDRSIDVAHVTDAGTATLRRFVIPTAVFFAATLAFGGITTFLPLSGPEPGVVAAALLALALAMMFGRVAAGAIGDRVSPGRMLFPAGGVAVAGMVGISVVIGTQAHDAAVVVAAAVFGIGFGAVQNDSLVLVLHRGGPGRHKLASTVWNIAFDAGVGVGAVMFGFVVSGVGYAWGFAAMGIMIAVLTPTAWRLGARPRTIAHPREPSR